MPFHSYMKLEFLHRNFSATYIRLERITLSVEAMLRLVEGLERTPHRYQVWHMVV